MKTLVELTAELQALFTGPEKWTQGESARNEDQKPVTSYDDSAFCFCLLGGIWKIQHEAKGAGLHGLCREAIREIDPGESRNLDLVSVAYWQDKPERTFADIQQVLAKMAEIAAR